VAANRAHIYQTKYSPSTEILPRDFVFLTSSFSYTPMTRWERLYQVSVAPDFVGRLY
jgi:hypothetical protein